MVRFAVLALALACATFTLAASPTTATAAPPPDQQVIVLLKDSSASPAAIAAGHARTRAARVRETYDSAVRGYAATVPADQVAALRSDPQVEVVVPDRTFTLARSKSSFPPFPQLIPYGIERVGATVSSTKAGDGRGSVDADIAIIDTGVGPHPDLNIAGGINCSGVGKRSDISDSDRADGHGTHVAGTAAAKDDADFYVGVAPGARIWSVKIFNPKGEAQLSNVLCGLDWVARNASFIDVANLSGADAGGSDDHNCGRSNNDLEHTAICAIVDRGVTVAVAAGNFGDDAAHYIPAAYDEVITVSAMTDTDGIPGGLDRDGREPTACFPYQDDTRAEFSNYGADVDITAPGVCVSSLSPFSPGAAQHDGTSMSAPHVSGAAALYISRHRFANPARVKAALLRAGSFTYDDSSDPDGIKEPLLDVSGF